MRVGKLFILLLLSIFLVSSVQAAVIVGTTVFHGDNFTSSIGGTFMLYGVSPYTKYNNATDELELYYKNIVISSTIDDTVTIKNNTCESTKKYTYCFKSSKIDMTNSRTFMMGDYLQPQMTITIESIPSPITTLTINRATSINSYCGEEILIPINITNGGTTDTNITYTETLPFNTVIISTEKGRVDGNIITFKDTILEGKSKNYSYVMVNSDCESKKWNATYTFTTYNDTLSRNITNLNITAQNVYLINESLSKNKTNTPSNDVTYTILINNTHPSLNIGLDLSLAIPDAIITETSRDLIQTQGMYKYVGTLSVRDSIILYIKFHEPDYGTYVVYNNATININNHVDQYNSNSTIQVLPAKVETYIDINTSKNNSLLVNIWAKNYDFTEKYYYIYGILKGFGEDEPFYVNGINPDSIVSIANKSYNTTGMGIKEINLVFDGVYRDKNSIEHPIYVEQKVFLNSPQASQPTATRNTTIASSNNSSNPVTSTDPQITTLPSVTNNDSSNATKVDKKDFITRFIESLSEFLQSIFG
jgi:hypothetical protein